MEAFNRLGLSIFYKTHLFKMTSCCELHMPNGYYIKDSQLVMELGTF